jgi:hypothetical protein
MGQMSSDAPSRTRPRQGAVGALPERYVSAPGVPSRPPRRPASPKVRRRRRLLILGVPVLVGIFFFWSVIGALDTPGNQSFSAKWADWLRAHHAAILINAAESYYYNSHKPKAGGAPKHLNALPPNDRTRTAGQSAGTVAHLPAPHPVALVVSPALPGEGQWQAVGPTVEGIPGMYEAQFRADTVYTSEITTAVWMDPKIMRLSLIPGLTEPGGTWSHPPYITRSELPTIAAAFNGGFRFQDAQGGFYLDGRTAVPLRQGAASFVIYRNGSVDVGAWGTEVTMTPQVVSVLQNLVPMVDHGQVSASATYTDARIWGSTLGAATVVARSGLGVTADGALVYVAGPALTARTLAESLQRAGAVRAMTLDINPEWVTFNFFEHADPSDPTQITPASLYPQMQRPATRYLGPTEESRDFVEVAAPAGATG